MNVTEVRDSDFKKSESGRNRFRDYPVLQNFAHSRYHSLPCPPDPCSNLDNASSKEEDDATDENQEEFDDNNEEASYPSDPSMN